MQDVCISFWKNDGTSDMMLKVTDICSTDPNDPTHCATPVDIKIDRGKAQIMEKLTTPSDLQSHPELMGDEYPEQIWWFFMKCWDDVRLHDDALGYHELTEILRRLSPNPLTKATIGSASPLSPITATGPKQPPTIRIGTTKKPMPQKTPLGPRTRWAATLPVQ